MLLLDTHVLIAVAEKEFERLPARMVEAVRNDGNSLFASVASVWEVAIKHRLGKLPLPCPIEEWPTALSLMGVTMLDTKLAHVLAEADPLPDTRDPFDRLLLAVCQVEGMRLLTVDRSLGDHPLAWRSGAA